MRFQEKCIDCSKRQGLRIYHLSLKKQNRVACQESETALLQDLDREIGAADPTLSPAELSLLAIRIGEKHAGGGDPFEAIKKKNNELALSLYAEMKERVESSRDPLHLACQLSACGNIIDLGIHEHFDIYATIEKVLREGFRRDDYPVFSKQCQQLQETHKEPRLFYICDNAGEIVFDRLLIEEIVRLFPRIRIIAAVRGRPVLNDATLHDAREIGLTEVVPVIDNGRSELGTVLEKSGEAFLEAYRNADLIVSKGQANYETLCGRSENIFFILQAKCDVIAESLGVDLWDAVLIRRADS